MKSLPQNDEGFEPDVRQHHKNKGTSEILRGPWKKGLEVLKLGYFALHWKCLAFKDPLNLSIMCITSEKVHYTVIYIDNCNILYFVILSQLSTMASLIWIS